VAVLSAPALRPAMSLSKSRSGPAAFLCQNFILTQLVLPINFINQGKTMNFKTYFASYNPLHLKSTDIGNTNLASKTGILRPAYGAAQPVLRTVILKI
jgi:hypothetical protein